MFPDQNCVCVLQKMTSRNTNKTNTFDFRGQQDTTVDSLEFSPLRAARSTPNLRKGKSTSRGRVNHTTRQRAESSLCLAQRDTSIPIRQVLYHSFLRDIQCTVFPFLAHCDHLNFHEFTYFRKIIHQRTKKFDFDLSENRY